MTRRALEGGVARVKIFSRDEAKQNDMRLDFVDPRLDFWIGDVRDQRSLDAALVGVDLVFHAAALKQVPSCEFFPLQAVLTNVLGSANVIDCAARAGVSSVVCLSTDKAVLPVSAMGMTKALMEKIAQAQARNEAAASVVSVVRYGNVMYSRGSVIPLFVKQVMSGLPLTITDPEMTRFLLPLSVGVELVDYAFTRAEPGDTFVRKAPAASVGTLAEGVRQLFDADNPIEIIGVRHGEKLFETLATVEELRNSTDEGDYLRIRMDGRGLDYTKYFTVGQDTSTHTEAYHSHNTERLDLDATISLLQDLPEIQEDLARWKAR